MPFNEDEVLANVRASVWRLILGFSSPRHGSCSGLIAGLSRRVADVLGPIVTAMNAISGIAWIPLAIAWFGIGTPMVVFIIWNAAFFLIFGNTMLGVRWSHRSSRTACCTLGASRLRCCGRSSSPARCPTSCRDFDPGSGSAGVR